MTDARYPERWLNDRRLLRLSGDDHSAFIRALAWSVANRTDGVIEFGDLKLIPCMADSTPDVLVKAGLWRVIDGGERFHIVDYEETQTSRDDLEKLTNMRRRERDNKRRQRAKAAAQEDVPVTVPRDVPGEETEDATRTGQARTGEVLDETNEEIENSENDSATGENHAVPYTPTAAEAHRIEAAILDGYER
jgi:hypothetical protein